ncbi:MAG: hypothetical protein ACK4OE_15780 [Acidovorax sp.]|uniref:hypothetical protein n=1 Tax=Acidovorax sp. TaxID=1872122 RepID=UPI00391C55E7
MARWTQQALPKNRPPESMRHIPASTLEVPCMRWRRSQKLLAGRAETVGLSGRCRASSIAVGGNKTERIELR